ncbi:MAG: DNA-processing protein DprA [Bryobacteraceae bacterium]|nr:DNA-processing protein DprA [Bryobacteraceae bacterium]
MVSAADSSALLPDRLTPEAELHWLALILTPGLGTMRGLALLKTLGTPETIFRSSPSTLEAAGVSANVARSIASGLAFDEAATQQELLRQNRAVLIPIGHPAYPARLRDIYDPPVALFARGRLELLDAVQVAMVGTRRPSPYGVAAADRLATDLALAGVTITSGMARGIDTAAHAAALKVKGGTIAVFGCGVDLVYPAENRLLAQRIREEGLVLSEFPMKSPAYPQNFPVRNRIVSGLAHGVCIVEGAQFSGSGITARLALDQNREVFAVPGNITSKESWGPNLLIKQGAKLVQGYEDILQELPFEARVRLRVQAGNIEAAAPRPAEDPAAPAQRAILGALREDTPIAFDTLAETLIEHSPSELIAALFELELEGRVKQLPGKQYLKEWR